MALFLLDRDGVVIVNRRDNIKNPADLELIAGVGPAIARLNQAGVTVAICTNQPEVARGVMTRAALDAVHRALADRLADEAATANRNLPIFMAHGTADPVVRFEWGDASRRALVANGYRVDWHAYRMEHSVCMEEIEAIGTWLVRTLAAE